MSLITELVAGFVWHGFMEEILFRTGRHVIRAISFGRIKIPSSNNREARMSSALRGLATLIAGAIFWLVIFFGLVIALYLAFA